MVKKIIIKNCPSCGGEPTYYYVGPLFNADLGLECKKCKIKAPARHMFWLSVDEWNNQNFEFGQLVFEL